MGRRAREPARALKPVATRPSDQRCVLKLEQKDQWSNRQNTLIIVDPYTVIIPLSSPIEPYINTGISYVSLAVLNNANWSPSNRTRYDNNTGIFTCPVGGVYVFQFHATKGEQYEAHVKLLKNGIPILAAHSRGQKYQIQVILCHFLVPRKIGSNVHFQIRYYIGRELSRSTSGADQKTSINHLFQRLSLTLQKGNTALKF